MAPARRLLSEHPWGAVRFYDRESLADLLESGGLTAERCEGELARVSALAQA